jgi:uncharacterized membrane protein YgcG
MLTALGLPAPEARRLQPAGTDEPAPTAPTPGPASAPTAATQIDEMFATVPQRNTAGTVWVWDDTSRTLTEKRVRLGISNGQLTALLEGDLAPGQQVVTNIVLASTTTATSTSQSVFGSAGRGGPGGGFGPGGFGPGGGGFGRGGGG